MTGVQTCALPIWGISARLLVSPAEMPLGVLTALLGAPVLVAVVRARRLPTL